MNTIRVYGGSADMLWVEQYKAYLLIAFTETATQYSASSQWTSITTTIDLASSHVAQLLYPIQMYLTTTFQDWQTSCKLLLCDMTQISSRWLALILSSFGGQSFLRLKVETRRQLKLEDVTCHINSGVEQPCQDQLIQFYIWLMFCYIQGHS
jgi:hypothetical protein